MNKKVKKAAYQLHLWIGCISGIIVFIVCLTGAIWAVGINNWLGISPENENIEAYGHSLLLPSQLLEYAKDSLQGNLPFSVTYNKDEATHLRMYSDSVNSSMTINPYSGRIINFKDYNKAGEYRMSFWDYMRWGHRALWLPWDVGRPIVNYGTLMFLITLITGLILWLPKSLKGIKNRLWFNWRKGTKIKRKIYDFHLILGFYSCFLLIVVCGTGMVWGLEWWSEALYKTTTGKDLPEWRVAESSAPIITDSTRFSLSANIDKLFLKTISENKEALSITINYPDTTNEISAIGIRISHAKDVLYNYDSHVYNRYTLQEVKQEGYQYGKYSEKTFGEKLRRQNYDLHIGSAWGDVGRVLMFFAAIFGASLPLTGYYILFRVKRKKKKRGS